MTINEEKLDQLLGQAVIDFGAAFNAPLVLIGDRLGLYKALAADGPLTSSGLAERTDTAERYVREWVRAQAASGYVTYDPAADRYSLTPEQALLFANENSPAFVVGNFQAGIAAYGSVERILNAFRTGEGVGWHEHDHSLFHATERAYRPGYLAFLVDEWIPALDGVQEKLERGARVADVGCGFGASTILMAKAFPNATFVGIDYHEASIAMARQRAEVAGVADQVRFEVADARTYDSAPYDFVTIFDALHDMGDPVGVAAHVRSTLAQDGTWMIVEPFANDRVEDNLNPFGRAFYAVSTVFCTPNALSQDGTMALGAQAGEARLREVVMQGGFTRFRRAAETPTTLIFEARP